MKLFSHKHKKWAGVGVLSLCLGAFLGVGFLLFIQPVHANETAPLIAAELAAGSAEGACVAGGPAPVPCPQKGIKQSLQIVGEKIFSPAFRIALIQALLNLSQFVLNRLAYEAAVAIASGGPGEDSLFYNQTPTEAFGQLGLEVAGEAIGSISELSSSQLGIEFNLCQPSLDLLQLSLALGIKQKYQPSAPKCDFMEVLSNWESFGAGIYQKYLDPQGRQDAILSGFASALRPGQNELTATLRINIAIDQKIHEQKLLQFLQRNESTYKDVTDFLTGNIKTPSETLQADFEGALKKSKDTGEQIRVGELANAGELIGGLALSTASTFTNVLLSKLLDRIYTGLFDSEVVNPFDLEATGSGDKEAAQERFASIITTNPIATTEYDALSEFVVCTAEGTINRTLNSCVMDVNFLAAVNRGTAGIPLTVQEAIDEGLLDGDWPLIPPDNEAANQDPFCYTYGYCYGNLVKLRKARVIPIGWELAAQRNSESNPATLQEVVDGFNNCTQDGTAGPASASDSESKWCHLIDPNWVLKYPKTQCRAVGSGEIRISTLSPGRNTTCVDSPSCIGEDNDGNCVDGYGYCVSEKNVWRFRGDECPEEYATCLSFTNTESGDDGDFLVSTVDYSVCGQDNAGCRWYRTSKYFEDAGTEDPDDDSYEWLADGDDYVISERDADMNYTSGSSSIGRTSYSYTSDSGEIYEYEQYAYEDRLYLTNDATECSDQDVGCTQLYEFSDTLYLNTVRNPSFEDDEDGDGTPDGWVALGGTMALETSVSEFGSTSVALTPSLTMHLEQFVDVADQNFYTFSAYFQAATDGATGSVRLLLLDEDGVEVDAAGTSSDGDCTWDSTSFRYEMSPEPSASDFERTECLFTVPEGTQQIQILIGALSSFYDVYVDAVQLELGEDANIFVEGYSGTPREVYYQIAPDYLGCSGAATDPEACDSYAQVCSAQEVGCSLYTPEDGDPNVPAIISELDECPSECVGYTTYKQEATAYESEEFPLYFIADSASSCAQQYIGCDSYTNLGSVEAGGEGIEYYTDLRFCLSTDIADATAANKTPATYFTWEGSDNEGYQLQTWSLLQSNYSGAKDTFDSSGFEETNPSLAPCTNIRMNAQDDVVCRDSNAYMQNEVWANDECDEHDDIFDNPDCREFFDTQGNIHYRQYSDTISISDECAAYRKDAGEETDCDDSGGWWTEQGFCRYYVLSEESTQCPAEQNGCREYTGGAGRNATTILDETFEGGTYEDFAIADTSTNITSVTTYISVSPDSVAISNESVATEGHSLYVSAPSTGIAGVETVYISNDVSGTSTTYDSDVSTTCSGTETDAGCEVTTDNNGGTTSEDESCVVADGADDCGTLASSLVSGKTFVLEFWAKGNGSMYVTFEEEGGSGDMHDFVNPEVATSDLLDIGDLTAITLDGSWELHSLGPLDTSDYDAFDESAVLRFAVSALGEFYIDNITLKQVEENITIIKDSWVVPSTCDQTPGGVDSDQYYLGCEAYTDHNGSDVDLYQFSDLCSEEVVGCDGFYATANSDSPYTQIYNARCVYSTDTNFVDDEIVTTNTACEVDGTEYCTISTGEGFCTFDTDQAFPGELPVESVSTSEYYAIVFGPETVVVSGDVPVYIVEDDSYACTSSVMGCQELGEPTYVQDQSEVESFESVYYINLPGDYDNILCSNEALFCEEWESTQDGNFYFKDPLDKECEYKTSVTIDSRAYFGWFRTGTTEPCYWEDKDGDGTYSRSGDEAYLIAGEEFGAWRNGDEDDSDDDTWDYYDGWVAACESKYDLCSEFIDVVDTGGGLNEDGQSYYFTNDDLLSEETLQSSQRCNGQVSQKFGCALFNNTTNSELTYNASASYVLSTHADVFYGTEMNDLVDPISCTTEDGGVFEISSASATRAGTDTEVDLCRRRCAYELDEDDSLTEEGSTAYVGSFFTGIKGWFGQSCFVDSDCPVLTTSLGEEETGTCANVGAKAIYLSGSDPYPLEDNTNEVLKVNRDRTCAAWLGGAGAKVSWNTQTNMYDYIYDSIEYCTQGEIQGELSICTQPGERDPSILSTYQYSARDVSWSGYEYSGNAIPNQLPIELYDQSNISAQSVCVDSGGSALDAQNADHSGFVEQGDTSLPIACASYADCPDDSSETCSSDSECVGENMSGVCNTSTSNCYYACASSSATDYRLVYNAGPCDSTESGEGNGGSCTVGQCEESGTACASDSDCASGDSCIVGYLQATGTDNCGKSDCSCNPDENDENDGTNPDCSGATASSGTGTEVCDPAQFVCVDVLTTDEDKREACVENDGDRVCVPSSGSTIGSCFNNRCLADIRDGNGDGYADRLETDDAREQACRAYPEIDSPFPTDVVTEWRQYSDAVPSDDNGDGIADIHDDGQSPGSITSGFQSPPTSQAALPYTFVNGFQDSTTCALDENGVPVDCLCSYDKAEYGDGTGYRYFELATGFDGIPKGICSGGPVSGIPCLNDDDCSTGEDEDGNFSQSGICSPVTRVDSVYGWNGYCIEKDTSIQTLGSPASEDQACLTWLPIDQLTGATDLYAKYTSAGYAPQDTYYCADIQPVYDVQTSNIGCAESLRACSAGLRDEEAEWDDETDTDYESQAVMSSGNPYDGSIGNIWCPQGYFAIMTGCGEYSWDMLAFQGITGKDNVPAQDGYCSAGGGFADYPYFCVPKFSYKTTDDLPGDPGDPCLTPEDLGFEYENSYNTSTYAPNGSISDELGIRVYVLKPSAFITARQFYNDCKAKGVSDISGYISPYTNADDGDRWDYDEFVTHLGTDSSNTHYYARIVVDEEGVNGATYEQFLNFQSYPACTTLVQTSTKTLDDTDSPFETYNAAWTERLWESRGYSMTDTSDYFGYEFDTASSPFGSATDPAELAATQDDPYPHLVSACEWDTDIDEDEDKTWESLWESVRVDATTCEEANYAASSDDEARAFSHLSYWFSIANEYSYYGLSELQDSGVYDYGSDAITTEEWDSAVDRIAQIFGRVYKVWRFNNEAYDDVASQYVVKEDDGTGGLKEGFDSWESFGWWEEVEDFDEAEDVNNHAPSDWLWSTRGTGRSDPQEYVPMVISIGDCEGTQCYEGVEEKFTVNGTDSEDIEGEGAKRVTVNFYAYADSEQMPIRRIVVDWGDDFTGFTSTSNPWPSGSQSPPSAAKNNFYRNHRGLNSDGDEVCSSEAEEFGNTPNACSSSYISFTNNYSCSQGRLNQLKEDGRDCNFDDDGRLLNSPCTGGESALGDGYCVFQPRVHVMDNWGWCTGFCDSGTDSDGTDGCYTGYHEDAPGDQQDECDITNCPSEGNNSSCDDYDEDSDGSFDTVNPWINYDGAVYILAE